MDGDAGRPYPRRDGKVGLYTFEKMWDNGFRQITSGAKPIESAKDMDGLKIRVPVSPLSISMFKALSASPTSLQFSEVYSALQTASSMRRKIRCRSSRSPSSTRCRSTAPSATTSGTASGSSPTAGPGKPCPADLKTIVANAINDAGLKQRDDIKAFNATVQSDLRPRALRSPSRRPIPSAPSCATPDSTASGKAASATRPGGCSKAPSASWPERR